MVRGLGLKMVPTPGLIAIVTFAMFGSAIKSPHFLSNINSDLSARITPQSYAYPAAAPAETTRAAGQNDRNRRTGRHRWGSANFMMLPRMGSHFNNRALP